MVKRNKRKKVGKREWIIAKIHTNIKSNENEMRMDVKVSINQAICFCPVVIVDLLPQEKALFGKSFGG